MKTKILLSVAALSILISATEFTSCKKQENNTPPTITLDGQNPWTIYLQSGATDPGITAIDNSGNSIPTYISSWSSTNPNQNQTGTYTITYSVVDANGNTATATRTVIVVNQAQFLQGNYNVSDVLSGDASSNIYYIATVNSSSTENNSISIANFGGFGTTVNVMVTLSSSNELIISPQTPKGMVPSPINNGLQGSGTVNSTGILSINYTVDYGGIPDYTINGTAVYTRGANKKK
ncbi:MAG: immunoglobulin-like domain-containing protein [Bacteroidales bacterium]